MGDAPAFHWVNHRREQNAADSKQLGCPDGSGAGQNTAKLGNRPPETHTHNPQENTKEPRWETKQRKWSVRNKHEETQDRRQKGSSNSPTPARNPRQTELRKEGRRNTGDWKFPGLEAEGQPQGVKNMKSRRSGGRGVAHTAPGAMWLPSTKHAQTDGGAVTS